jgi:NAD(P)-dependent dehydrogenase (short-subunit alcohol dehydrogenase family)
MDEPKVILITGCSSGLGRAAAEVLSGKGYRVYAGMRESGGRNAEVASMLRSLNQSPRFLRVLDLDICSDSSVAAAVEETLRDAGKIDVLVNNAGVFAVGPAEAFRIDQWKALFETNLFGAVRMNRAVLPSMRQRKAGMLVHISSVAGRSVGPGMAVYCASKSALAMLAEAYRYELAPFGIDSLLIEPFVYPTGIHERFSRPADESRAAEYLRLTDLENRQVRFFQTVLKSPNAGNPAELGEKVDELIRTPLGKRPLHTVLPASMQERYKPVDTVLDHFRQRSMETVGFKDLLEQRAREP